jgi:hypothetical protein
MKIFLSKKILTAPYHIHCAANLINSKLCTFAVPIVLIVNKLSLQLVLLTSGTDIIPLPSIVLTVFAAVDRPVNNTQQLNQPSSVW